jgi:hypothetical protein
MSLFVIQGKRPFPPGNRGTAREQRPAAGAAELPSAP